MRLANMMRPGAYISFDKSSLVDRPPPLFPGDPFDIYKTVMFNTDVMRGYIRVAQVVNPRSPALPCVTVMHLGLWLQLVPEVYRAEVEALAAKAFAVVKNRPVNSDNEQVMVALYCDELQREILAHVLPSWARVRP